MAVWHLARHVARNRREQTNPAPLIMKAVMADPFKAEVDQGARWLSPSSPNSHDVTASANPTGMPTPQGLRVSTRKNVCSEYALPANA